MPYTTKSTAYFGSNGKITYISPDDAVMKYSIYTKNGTTIAENREYDSTKGISLAALSAFDALLLQPVQRLIYGQKREMKKARSILKFTPLRAIPLQHLSTRIKTEQP